MISEKVGMLYAERLKSVKSLNDRISIFGILTKNDIVFEVKAEYERNDNSGNVRRLVKHLCEFIQNQHFILFRVSKTEIFVGSDNLMTSMGELVVLFFEGSVQSVKRATGLHLRNNCVLSVIRIFRHGQQNSSDSVSIFFTV